MKDESVIAKCNLTFIALTTMAITHNLWAWITVKFGISPEFGPGGGGQLECNTRNISHAVNNPFTNGFHHLDANFHFSSPLVHSEAIDNILRIILWSIRSTGTDRAMAQPHNDQGGFDEGCLDSDPAELKEQPDISFNHLSSLVAALDACMRFSAVLPMGRFAIASSGQAVPGSNSNGNDITNIASDESPGFVDGGTIVEGVMSLGGELCQRSDLGYPLCAILF